MWWNRITAVAIALAGCIVLSPQNGTAAPGDLLFKLTAPDSLAGAGFGEIVANVDGDILVAEPNRRIGPETTALGRAYLFDGQTGKLKWTFDNPEPTNQDLFARALAGGDGRVFISKGGTNQHVYAFSTATGKGLYTIDAPAGADTFGFNVAYGDGSLLISDPSFTENAQLRSVGRAYLFDASSGTLERPLPNPEPKDGDGFGSGNGSLAIIGDKAIVGANLDDVPNPAVPGQENQGRVWVFDRRTGAVLSTLENPNPTARFFDWFGWSVSANEQTIVVGAQEDGTAGPDGSGTAYVFESSTGDLLHTLLSPQPEVNGEFGQSVAVTADGNVLVGAWNTSVNGISSAGHAYLFDGVTGGLILDIPNPEAGKTGVFGWSVAAAENRIIVGAPSPGAVYVFEGIPEPSSIALGVASLMIGFATSLLLTRRQRP